MHDLAINLLASVIAGVAVWAAQRLVRLRDAGRKRAFFGVEPGAEVLMFVAKHHSSPRPSSVHREDVATLIELASAIKDCGGEPTLVVAGDARRESGRLTEYCVGGPITNPRTAAYLRLLFPGVRMELAEGEGIDDELPVRIGERVFTRTPGREEYVLLIRTVPPEARRPVFLLIGQTARTNHAAARYLTGRRRRLEREFRERPTFCLLLRVREASMFGGDHVERVAEVTAEATRPLPSLAAARAASESDETAVAVDPPRAGRDGPTPDR